MTNLDIGLHHDAVPVSQSGYELLTSPALNKGTAFTERERWEFGLNGLLPAHVSTLAEQVERRLLALRGLSNDLDRYVYLRDLQDTNETLFYSLLVSNTEELLPIVYTPTVGPGSQQFSRIFRRPRGYFLSIPLQNQMKRILSHDRFDNVEVIVVTDGERVLGLGDQGVGGMGISIGKTALYTCCAGLHPSTTLPIFLDVGTDNQALLNDPLYMGWRHPRVTGEQYDEFLDAFVVAVNDRWPHVVLQWEDFGRNNALRLLNRYRDRLCTFNDDVQGTAAAATGTLLAALNVTNVPITDQRICILGAGSAGCGIAGLLVRAMVEAGLSDAAAARSIFMVDVNGLLLDDMPELSTSQYPFARAAQDVVHWTRGAKGGVDLLETVTRVKPTVLIGVSGQRGAFSEAIVRKMAEGTFRPIIFPLSNPTACCEAEPADLYAWTDDRAIVGVGSPFPPFERNGVMFSADQVNNSYIFPGVGLGAVASKALRISDGMFMAAAKTLADISRLTVSPNGNILPPVSALRGIAFEIAKAVGSKAQDEMLAIDAGEAALVRAIRQKMWNPAYDPYVRSN
ncbi:NAD-dependent malic enzyme [Rhodopseudomonas sp. RCAM05734]|uniref:NAD-dependent malic enzyme n=1 Tax=Rhodopseudomonas sp. RCAM05734 TaxID=3457549 RepID=UPI004044ACEB